MNRDKLLSGIVISLCCVLVSCSDGTSSKSSNGSDFDKGRDVYARTCVACHLADGKGIAMTFPPLAKSDFLARGKKDAIVQVIKGKTGALIVNGMPYNNIMPPQGLSDEDIAHVLTYVYGSFGNNGTKVSVEEVKAVRNKIK